MAEVSNKTLALLLVAAIVISLGGMLITLNRLSSIRFFGPGITGLVTDTGSLSLTILENVAINFTQETVNFGTGYVDNGKSGCEIGTNLTNGSENNCTSTSGQFDTQGNFVVENIGNTNVTLNISGKTARVFFGLSGGNYSFNVTPKDGECGCCNGSSEGQWDVDSNGPGTNTSKGRYWTVFTGTAAANYISLCNNSADSYGFGFEQDRDEFYINLKLNVPYNAYGAFSDTITLDAATYTNP